MNHKDIELVKEDLSDELLDFYSHQKLLALDGEMMGLNIVRDRLCLVQLCSEDAKTTLIQISQNQKHAPKLQQLLENPEITKVFHYARTDVAWLKYWLNIQVRNYFCSKVASKLARTYTDKHGLKDICKEIIGKELNKNQQSSDWGAEHLNQDQKKYAATDVIHLIEIYHNLNKMLRREGRLDLALRAMQHLDIFVDLDIGGFSGVFEH